MKILIIHKEPIIERIPNLKAFIVYSSSYDHKITILTTKNKIFPEPSFPTKNIKYIAVEERNRKWQLPTFIRFYTLCIFVLVKNIFRKYSLLLAGKYAIAFGAIITILHLKKYSSFIIEYPELNKENGLDLIDKLELKGIRFSKFLITHDKLHADFIAQQMKILDLKFVTIPNGTIGEGCKVESNFLQNRLKISKKRKILLHSGGFGPWFDSENLAGISANLPPDYDLIFHISHNIIQDSYYKNYLTNKKEDDRTLFSMEPVSTDKLDELIASAYIGIACYSISELGYRATMLGLAAGKIGNYLKCGIPVIVPDYNSFNYITDFNCGKQINELKDLNNAIFEIEANYSLYSHNAIKCYNDLWNTEKYCENLLIELCCEN